MRLSGLRERQDRSEALLRARREVETGGRDTYRSPVHVVAFRAHSCHPRRPRWHYRLVSRVSLVLKALLLRNCYLFPISLITIIITLVSSQDAIWALLLRLLAKKRAAPSSAGTPKGDLSTNETREERVKVARRRA